MHCHTVRSVWRQATDGRTVTLKIVFLLHLFFVTWASSGEWLPYGSVMYNAFFLMCLLWGINKKSKSCEAVKMALAIDVMSIILDIWTMALYALPYHWDESRYEFGRVVAVILIISRPVSIYLCYRYIKRFVPEGTITPSAPQDNSTTVTTTSQGKDPEEGVDNNQSPAIHPTTCTMTIEDAILAAPPPPYELNDVHRHQHHQQRRQPESLAQKE